MSFQKIPEMEHHKQNFQHIQVVPAFFVVTFNCIQIIFVGCLWIFWRHYFFFQGELAFFLAEDFHNFLFSQTILDFPSFSHYLDFFGWPHFWVAEFHCFSLEPYLHFLVCAVEALDFICFRVPWLHWTIQNTRNMFWRFCNWLLFGSNSNFLIKPSGS